jgi:enamine deaminase RidA (YjgF/YER057c/UK114 family)
MNEPESITPAGWPRASGYAHGMVARGRVVVTAGQIGWDPVGEQVVSDDLTAQVRQALANVVAILGAAGAAPEHLVRLTWYVTDRAAYLESRQAIGAVYREIIGRHYPAMAVIVVSALVEARAKVEIEATAVVPD